MPHASRRIDVVLVPADPDAAPDLGAGRALAARWGARLDDPRRVAFYANLQGGFRARCPVSREIVTAAFGSALEAWRAGGPRRLSCPTCGAVHALEALAYEPEAAFARAAIVIADAASVEQDLGLVRDLEAAWGPVRVVVRRVA